MTTGPHYNGAGRWLLKPDGTYEGPIAEYEEATPYEGAVDSGQALAIATRQYAERQALVEKVKRHRNLYVTGCSAWEALHGLLVDMDPNEKRDGVGQHFGTAEGACANEARGEMVGHANRMASVLSEYTEGCLDCKGTGTIRYKPTERLHNDDWGERSCSRCSTRRERGRHALKGWVRTKEATASHLPEMLDRVFARAERMEREGR